MINKKGYSKNFKLRCINLFLSGQVSINKSAKMQKIHKQTLSRWIKLYSLCGETGLKNKKPGAREVPIDLDTEKMILRLWNENKRSKYGMCRDLKINGINLSKWHVQKIYKKYKLSY
ncbi:helix-turn-helix domain-containing protein [Candidatus Woesearchaeota archaeon]|nr:helix-turn-helix domain-containing protein [Candidatus Woesearchaeota archaeon]